MKIIKIKKCNDCPWFKESFIQFEGSTNKHSYSRSCTVNLKNVDEITLRLMNDIHGDNLKTIPDWCPLENDKKQI